MKKTHCITFSADIGSNLQGAGEGPMHLKKHFKDIKQLEWVKDIHGSVKEDNTSTLENIHHLCNELSQTCEQLTPQNQPILVFAGDHSSAIGTWSGVSSALSKKNEPLGLIWIDAHLDAHTMETSITKNPHGMPAAALLGFGDPLLTQISHHDPKIAPENLFYIGARSYETAEQELLRSLNVTIYDINTMKKKNIHEIINEIIATLKKNNVKNIGITVDLDALDPRIAPAVTVPEANGLSLEDVTTAITLLKKERHVVAYEFCEFCPSNDIDNQSLHCCDAIIKSMINAP